MRKRCFIVNWRNDDFWSASVDKFDAIKKLKFKEGTLSHQEFAGSFAIASITYTSAKSMSDLRGGPLTTSGFFFSDFLFPFPSYKVHVWIVKTLSKLSQIWVTPSLHFPYHSQKFSTIFNQHFLKMDVSHQFKPHNSFRLTSLPPLSGICLASLDFLPPKTPTSYMDSPIMGHKVCFVYLWTKWECIFMIIRFLEWYSL